MGALLVVAAHPDDETVGAASLLLRAKDATLVHVTDGAPLDPALRPGHPDRAAYARLRRREALEALALAGVAPKRVLALSAEDQGVVRVLGPLIRELASVLSAVSPRLVVTHAFEGGHPDHDATALAVRAALALIRRHGNAPRHLEMTGYHREGGRLVTGVFLPGPRAARHRLTPAERETKRHMFDRYASQRAALAGLGLEVLDEEQFRVPSPLRPWQRPHAGPLNYEVQGWCTFEEFRGHALEGLRSLGIESLVETWEATGAPP